MFPANAKKSEETQEVPETNSTNESANSNKTESKKEEKKDEKKDEKSAPKSNALLAIREDSK